MADQATNGTNAEPKEETAERGYLHDAPDLGIRRTRLSQAYWDRATRRYLKAAELAGRRGGFWLDCACGSGFGTEVLAGFADYVMGIDIDAPTIEYARRFHGQSTKVTFRAGDLTDLKLSWDAVFDVVVSIETIEHVPDCVPLLKQTYTSLKPGGVAVITTPASTFGGGPNPLNPFHPNELTEEQFRQLMADTFDESSLYGEEVVLTTGEHTRQLFGVGRKRA